MARETWRRKSKRCGARKRDGSPCPTWAMPNGRCRMHGGSSNGRPIVHGRRSRNPLLRVLSHLDGLDAKQAFDVLMLGTLPNVTPCSRTNPMHASGASGSLPKAEPLPGSVIEQYRTVKGVRYGPYYFRAYRVGHGSNRKQRKEYVPRERVEEVREACARWKALHDLPEPVKRAGRDFRRKMRGP